MGQGDFSNTPTPQGFTLKVSDVNYEYDYKYDGDKIVVRANFRVTIYYNGFAIYNESAYEDTGFYLSDLKTKDVKEFEVKVQTLMQRVYDDVMMYKKAIDNLNQINELVNKKLQAFQEFLRTNGLGEQ